VYVLFKLPSLAQHQPGGWAASHSPAAALLSLSASVHTGATAAHGSAAVA
jgi:hypothetical protein